MRATQASDDDKLDIRRQCPAYKGEDGRGDLSITLFVSHASCSILLYSKNAYISLQISL
jgi:hypothetical protein